MLEQVARTVTRYNMIPLGSRVGVAVSGGPDSVALLHVLKELAPPNGWTLVVLHLDHAIRGEESAHDARFVKELAARLELQAIVERRELPQPRGANVEERARGIRYAFFADAMKRARLDRIAVGHTRSDQAETVLFRLLRGSATAGLAGIWPVTAEGIVRPLIEVDRTKVLEFLQTRGIGWREDSSNRDQRFARNRIRHDLLPQLRRDWNPGLDEALARLADVSFEEERYWKEESARLIESAAAMRDGACILDLRALKGIRIAALRRMLRLAVSRLRPGGRPLDFEHVDRLAELAAKPAGSGRVTLPGIEAWRSFHWLRLSVCPAENRRRAPFRLPLPVPGEAILPGGVRVRAQLEKNQGNTRYNVSSGASFSEALDETLDWEAALDWEQVGVMEASPGLELRSWAPGMAFRPSGGSREYKLKELFQQARVPRWERREWPMVVRGEAVIWVRGFGPADGFAAADSTKTVLRLRGSRLAETQAEESSSTGGPGNPAGEDAGRREEIARTNDSGRRGCAFASDVRFKDQVNRIVLKRRHSN